MVWTAKTLVLAIGLGLAGSASAAGNLYCCNDPASGRQVCADQLPVQCRGHAYRILDANANLIREVEAPLTPEQKLLRAADARRKKQEDEAILEQRRKDQALLDTYSSYEDISRAQQRAEQEVVQAIRNAEAKVAEVRRIRKKYENEAEFYKGKTLPADVSKGLREADFEINAQNELITAKQREMGLIKGKYDADRRRYQELTASPAPRRAWPEVGAGGADPRTR